MALSSCHRSKIIHRDIKASNLLIDDLGNLILSDFGFLKLILQADSDFESFVEPLVGSEMNMAPEWVQKEKCIVTEKSDIW